MDGEDGFECAGCVGQQGGLDLVEVKTGLLAEIEDGANDAQAFGHCGPAEGESAGVEHQRVVAGGRRCWPAPPPTRHGRWRCRLRRGASCRRGF